MPFYYPYQGDRSKYSPTEDSSPNPGNLAPIVKRLASLYMGRQKADRDQQILDSLDAGEGIPAREKPGIMGLISQFITGDTQSGQSSLERAMAEAQIKKATLSPTDELIQRGKAADAEMKIYEAGGAAPSLFIGAQAPTVPQIQGQGAQLPVQPRLLQGAPPAITGRVGQPAPGDIVPTGYDPFLRPKGYERVKKTAAQEKRDVEITELGGQISNLVGLFKRARKEAGTVPNVGKPGLSGRVAGIATVLKGKTGYSPAVNVYQDKIKAFATIVAKAAGEVRPTDNDIKRFVNTLPTLAKNDAENKIIIEQLKADLRARGAKVLWEERTQGGVSSTAKPTANKKLDPNTAREILNQAGGNKNKARKMATQMGYSF